MLRSVFFCKGSVSIETVMIISATNPFTNRRRVSFLKGNVSKETIMIISATNPFTNRQTVSFFKGNVSMETIMVILAIIPFTNRRRVSFFKGNVSVETVMIISATFPPHRFSFCIAARETMYPAFHSPLFIELLLLRPCRFLRMTFFCRLRTSIQGTRKAFG